ncbi:uncharacterized protein LOC128285484 [Gossypium arboreum]|uniref:uncharacterized protein LOC128285484 n=1 Tax=Gossypium arboreum TaxID=29729 RepID=UPI0022F1906C|nr:uncharacterized protein LOC128285484 [Gossypium arboreum]
MQCYKVQPSSPNKPAKEEIQIRKLELLALSIFYLCLIMFEQHCNIENLGRVNKVKVKRQITVKSLQLEPLCNQSMEKFFKFSTMKLDRNMNHTMITSAYRFCSYRGHKSSQLAFSDLVFDGMANTLIRDGKEMASMLYTYRNCVKALPPYFSLS